MSDNDFNLSSGTSLLRQKYNIIIIIIILLINGFCYAHTHFLSELLKQWMIPPYCENEKLELRDLCDYHLYVYKFFMLCYLCLEELNLLMLQLEHLQ